MGQAANGNRLRQNHTSSRSQRLRSRAPAPAPHDQYSPARWDAQRTRRTVCRTYHRAGPRTGRRRSRSPRTARVRRRPRDRPGTFGSEQDADRALFGRPVVRQNGRAGSVGHGCRDRRPRRDHPASVHQRLPGLAFGKAGLAGQPTTLVGSPHSHLVEALRRRRGARVNGSRLKAGPGRAGWRGSLAGRVARCTRRPARRDGPRLYPRSIERTGRALRDTRLPSRRRRARYLVQLCALAALHTRLAGTHARTRILLSYECPRHQSRYHHSVGRPDGADGAEQHGRSSVPRGLHPSEDPRWIRRDDVEVERERGRSDRRD